MIINGVNLQDRKLQMGNSDKRSDVVKFDDCRNDLLKLSADSVIKHTKTLENAAYIFAKCFYCIVRLQDKVVK